MSKGKWLSVALILSTILVLVSCPKPPPGLIGVIEIDGSSTVYPITEAVAEEFRKVHRGVLVNVGISGTGGGFKRFIRGETDINNASRPISPKEKEAAVKAGIEWIELKIAYDAISVVVNPKNTWVDYLTVEELKRIWEPGSTIKKWNQIRPDWPDRPLNLYGPGTDSGTFDYFTEVIVGKAKASRPDYTASEDDNVLVLGVAGDVNALAYFGFAYYITSKEKVRAVPIDGGKGPVMPSEESVYKGTYVPLSRPLFIYVNKKALERPEVKEFVKFYLNNAPKLAKEVGYIPMPQEVYIEGLKKIK